MLYWLVTLKSAQLQPVEMDKQRVAGRRRMTTTNTREVLMVMVSSVTLACTVVRCLHSAQVEQ